MWAVLPSQREYGIAEGEQKLLRGEMVMLKPADLQFAGVYLGNTLPLGILVELSCL